MLKRPLDEKLDDKLMQKLINANGISGNEEEVRKIIISEVKSHATSIKTNKMGNLIVRKKGNGPKLMLTAHMDEIGLMVKSIDKYGKVFFSPIGGIIPDVLLGERVHINGKKKSVFGVITCDQLSNDEEIDKQIEMQEMHIDTGYWKPKLKTLGVEVGNYINFEPMATCNCHKKMLFGKALDDRIGCYALIQLIKKIKKSHYDLYFVFTVQEEIGAYGSKSSVWDVSPDLAIVVDITTAQDNVEDSTKILGNGPVLTIKDEEIISDKKLTNWLKTVAKKTKTPLQLEVTDIGATDALGISVYKTGVPTTIIGVPIRNIHSTFSVAHPRDINNLIKILTNALKKKIPQK
jgi:tetrahedral aminopeptidase